MTDAAWDALEDELRAGWPKLPYFQPVGAAPTGSAWPEVEHDVPMKSNSKAVGRVLGSSVS